MTVHRSLITNQKQQPKVAVFYDWLNQWGGAEKVLLDILTIYPQADLYTLVHNPSKSKWLPQNIKIQTSFLSKLPFSDKNPIIYTPLYAPALEQFNFDQYDILISTTSVLGHCFLTRPQTLFICYAHNINRYLYQTPQTYRLLSPLLDKYKKIDYIYAQRPDYYLCNSRTVADRIMNSYRRNSIIIHPGVDIDIFKPSYKPPSDYFLLVSRLVQHKRIDLALSACCRLNKKLYIVGEGREYQKIKNQIKHLNTSNIKLLGSLSQEKLIHLYQHCQALICPQLEDFGLSPLEAQACGRPVIAFKQGGLTETVINGKTGLFFDEQSTDSLAAAILNFDSMDFSPDDCRAQAKKFSKLNFMLHFKQQIESLWQHHRQIKITT